MLQWHRQTGANLLVSSQKLFDGLGLVFIRGHCFPTHALILLARAFTCVDRLVEQEYLLASKFL